jgi:hypothetical protein
MNSFNKSLRGSLPPKIIQILRDGRNVLCRAGDLPSLYFHPWRMDSNRRIRRYQDRCKGDRCFIIGNGPSLKKTDLSFLKNEITFGMNRIYLAFDDWGFQTSFLVSVNSLVIEQCRDEFQGLSLPKFFSWRSRKLLYPEGNPDEMTYFLDTTYTWKKFADRLNSRYWEGGTVTYVCLQLAFWMGFHEVYLIGVDHNFETKGSANKTVVSNGDDPNHFSPDYFGKGFRWQLPDLETSEIAYELADAVYRQNDRQVIDATVGGTLTIFPKMDYRKIFE